MSEPKGRGAAWTEERGARNERTSDEGRKRLKSGPEASEPVLELSGVAVDYGRRGQRVRALDGVDLTVGRGEIVGLVGESGCGKSTLARASVGLEPLAAGTVTFEGHDVTPLGRRRRPGFLRGLQMVFQDPYESLNPRRKIGELIADGVRLGGGSRAEGVTRAAELLDRVGLPASATDSYPHEFSGGQRQRIAIARTLATQPSCLIADEPISALDASAQAQIANLLSELVDDGDLGLVLVSHDLSVVRQVASWRSAAPGPSGPARGTPTPRRWWPRSRAPTGAACCRPTCPATCPTRPTRRPAAGSTRAARSPRTAAVSSTSG